MNDAKNIGEQEEKKIRDGFQIREMTQKFVLM